MSISKEIEEHLKNDINLVQNIESLMCKVDVMSNNERNMLLAGFSRNLLSHFLSINILMERKLYNSAFALERIFFENIIKLKYMYYIMDDRKISIIYNANSWDNHFPYIKIMTNKIDEKYGVEFYSKIKDSVYKIMCDYTHTGKNQIARNFSGTDLSIESNFSNELILDTLKGNRILLKTTIIIFLEEIGLRNNFISENEIKEYEGY